jgi:tetratricopeptide (TPR) repeat protein
MISERKPAKINWKLVVILAVAVVVLGVGAIVARYVRKEWLASKGLADGQAAYQQGDWKGAVAGLREYLARFPDNPEVLEQYARANLLVRPLDVGNIFAAIDAYRRILRLSPDNASVYRPLAILYAYTGQSGELGYIAEQRLKQAPGDPHATLWLAQSLVAQTDRTKRDEARAKLEELVNAAPKQAGPRAPYVKACILLGAIAASGDSKTARQDALKWLDRAIERDPGSADVYLARARVRLLPPRPEGKAEQDAFFAAAKADLDRADALQPPDKPSDPGVRLGLAAEWIRHGDFAKAEAELNALDAMLVPVKDAEGNTAGYYVGSPKGGAAVPAGSGAAEGKDLLAYDIVDPMDLVAVKSNLRSRIVASRRSPSEGVALADETLAAVKSKRHRLSVLPSAIERYATAGKVAEARACLDEYVKANEVQPVPEPREKVAWLEALVAQAEGKPSRIVALLQPVTAAGLLDYRSWIMMAQAYRQTSQPQLAARALDECRRLIPRDPSLMRWLAREYRFQGRWSEALQAATAASQLAADDLPTTLLRIEIAIGAVPEPADARGKADLEALARELAALRRKHAEVVPVRVLQDAIAMKQGRLDDAQKELEETIKTYPEAETLSARMMLAQVYVRQQRTDDALRTCREASDKYKKQAAPWQALAEVLASNKRYDEARAALQAAVKEVESREDKRDLKARLDSLEIANGSPQSRTERAKALVKEDTDDVRAALLLLQFPEIRNDEALAQALVNKIREIQGDSSVLGRLYQVELWMSQNRWRDKQKEIADALNRCMAADPKWSEPVLLLGSMHERLADLGGAEAVYRRAFASNPEATDVADRLMVLLERRGRFTDAKEVLDKVGKGSGVLDAHRWRVAYGEGDVAQAVEQLRLRMAQDPKDAVSRVDLARVLYEQKRDVDAAMKYLDEAAAIAPESLVPIAIKAAILEREGRRDEARRHLDEEVAKRNSFAAYLVRADYRAATGDTALAEQDYAHLTTFGMNGDGHLRLARFYTDSGNWDKAVNTLEEGAKAYSANRVLQDRLMRALFSRNKGDDRARASQILAALEKTNPNDPGVLGIRALELLREGKQESTQKAQQLLERVVQLAPSAVDAYMALFGLAMDRMDIAGARDLAIRATEANPGHRDLLLARADAERRLGNLGMAREVVRTLLKQNPDDPGSLDALVSLAGSPPDAKVLEEAQVLANQAANRKPSDERLQLVVARALDVAGQRDAAIARLDAYRQTEAGRSSVNVLLALADLCRAAGNLAACKDRIEQASKLAPDHPGVVQQQILYLAAAKQFDEIASLMSALARKQPGDAGTFLVAAKVLHSGGADSHRKAAKACYEEALRNAPLMTEALLGLALLTYQGGDISGAEMAYVKVIEAHPNNPQALNDLAWILSESKHDYKRAIELADRGVALVPDDDHLRDTRGVVLMRVGRLQDARKDFEKMASLNPPDSPRRAKALLQLGRVCAKMNDAAQAKRYLEEALQIDSRKSVFSAEERAEARQLLLASAGN